MYEPSPKSSPFILDRSKVDPVVDPVVRSHGGELVDLEFKSEQGGWVLRVFVEKAGSAATSASTQNAAVDLDLCSRIAKDLSPALDVVDVIPHRYHLEVSSPGVERPLKKPADFARFAGKKAKLKLSVAVRGQKVLVGLLGPLKGDTLTISDGDNSDRAYDVRLCDIEKARLVFEFGPQPKPSHSAKKKHK